MTDMVFYILVFFAGAAFGSFYYTLYVRFASESDFSSLREILTRQSSCPHCGKKIHPVFLIPVAGFFLSGGKCRSCDAKISYEYPLFEIFSGSGLILLYMKYGHRLLLVPVFLACMTSVTLSMVDLKRKIIPDFLVIMLFLFSVPIALSDGNLSGNLYGLLFMGAVFGVILLVFPGSFGGGDFKYAAVIGFLLGFESSVIAFEISVITGAVIGTAYGLLTKKGLRIKIPFGPFLTAGLLISMFYGTRILLIYRNILK